MMPSKPVFWNFAVMPSALRDLGADVDVGADQLRALVELLRRVGGVGAERQRPGGCPHGCGGTRRCDGEHSERGEREPEQEPG